jgi:hypothetical protein
MDYCVSKQYGHFVQMWRVFAKDKEEAWKIAETEGRLMYQNVYEEIYPDRNYVKSMEKISDNQISKEQYNIWLEEAISLGMKLI